MENILLVNMDDILHYSQLSPTIDIYKLNPHILNAQILYLEPLLGTSLYEKILDLVSTGSITGYSYADYNILLSKYITPSVVYHSIALFIPLNAFEMTNGGTFQYSPTNATASVLTDIDKISNKYNIVGSKYDDKLQSYLNANSSLFIEYTTNTGLVKRTENSNRIGWFLGLDNTQSKIRI